MLVAVVAFSLLNGYVATENMRLRGQLRDLHRHSRDRDHVITDLFDCVVDYADHISA